VKVLILHQHFKIPQYGGAIRSYYLARALVEKGIRAVVVTAHNAPGYRKESIDEIDVHYLPVRYDNRFGFTRRIFAFYKFAIKAATFSAGHRDADICYAISTPLTIGIAALMVRRRFKIPYIFEVGDLWPDAPIEMGFIRNPLLLRLLYRMEKRIYRNAQSIVALSMPIRDAINKKISGKNIHLVRNMADTDFYKPEEKRLLLEEKFGTKGKFVISYIGALGVANGLDYILACAVASRDERLPIHFLICGDGAMLPMLRTSAMDAGLANLSFVPFQNRDGVAATMNITDATFICYQPFPILETGSPNKYFDGLAAGKLTIVNFGGWIKDEISREACGIYADAHTPTDFVTKIKPFLQDPWLLKNYQQRARQLAERKYCRKMLAEKFADIMKKACESKTDTASPDDMSR
jgi:glycosyltransferase involved in cell wall biosynthesis